VRMGIGGCGLLNTRCDSCMHAPVQAAAALKAARDKSESCQAALKAAERQLSELELAAPKASVRVWHPGCLKAGRHWQRPLTPRCLRPLCPLQARMEAEAEAAKAADIQQRLGELRAATQV
jgi:hypothetical protein